MCHWQCPPQDAVHIFLPDTTWGVDLGRGCDGSFVLFLSIAVVLKIEGHFIIFYCFLVFFFYFLMMDGLWSTQARDQI